MIILFDCQSCGACCDYKSSWPIFKRDRSDATGISPSMQRQDLPLMRTEGTRCVALCGTVGTNCSCRIYSNRPSACRSFQSGSALCLEARAAKGFSNN